MAVRRLAAAAILFWGQTALAEERVNLTLTNAGDFLLEGDPIDRDDLRDHVRSTTETNPDQAWVLLVSSTAASHDLAATLAMLKREGATQFSVQVVDAAPANETPTETSSTPVVLTQDITPEEKPPVLPSSLPAASPDHSGLRPVGEVRFGLLASGLNETPTTNFELRRATVGFSGSGHNTQGQLLINIVEDIHDESDESIRSSSFRAQVRDAWIDMHINAPQQFRVRAGVQPMLFSTNAWFHERDGGFAMLGPEDASIATQAGLIQDRGLGLRGDLNFSDNRGHVAAMVDSGEGYLSGSENTPQKEASAQILYNLNENSSAQLSALYKPAEDNVGDIQAISGALRNELNRIRLVAEAIYGMESTEETQSPFLGLQGAGGLMVPVTLDAIDHVDLLGRFAYFDPHLETTDADAWMLFNASAQGWWHSDTPDQVITALSYQIRVPTNATIPIEYTGMVEFAWGF